DGEAGGQPFGTQVETGTQWGAYGALGIDWFVGPGAALFEVQGAWAAMDGFVMRDTHLSTVNLALGYRLML
ncbi:MAG: hypothetical protein KC613_27325, partial [Myxococcales bacterium]|nr:hypothetical protein [Myxococcales bacterium]